MLSFIRRSHASCTAGSSGGGVHSQAGRIVVRLGSGATNRCAPENITASGIPWPAIANSSTHSPDISSGIESQRRMNSSES